MSRLLVPWTLGVALLVLVCGCAGRDEPPASQPASSPPTAAGLPDCASVREPVALPSAFPAGFPLPPGTVVTSTQERTGGRIVIEGVAPSNFKTTLRYFQQALPKAGFRLGEGEVEPNDAESSYEGKGYRGRWSLESVANCPNFTSVTILSQRR